MTCTRIWPEAGSRGAAPTALAPRRLAPLGAYLGPAFAQSEIEDRLAAAGAVFETLAEDHVIARTAEALAAEQAVGWFC